MAGRRTGNNTNVPNPKVGKPVAKSNPVPRGQQVGFGKTVKTGKTSP